jgi:hypothetical protein
MKEIYNRFRLLHPLSTSDCAAISPGLERRLPSTHVSDDKQHSVTPTQLLSQSSSFVLVSMRKNSEKPDGAFIMHDSYSSPVLFSFASCLKLSFVAQQIVLQ